MFRVGRFDPREEDRKKKLDGHSTRDDDKKKRRKSKVRSAPLQADVSTPKQKKRPKDKYSDRKKKSVKREETDDRLQGETNEIKSTLRVIAPETQGPVSLQKKLSTKLSEEAFDDLDIADDIVAQGVNEKVIIEDIDQMKNDIDVAEQSQEIVTSDPVDEIQRALHMSRQPIQDAAKGLGLAPFLLQNLRRDGYEHLFPIQALVIPDVIAAERHAHIQARDICVAAPTGTLSLWW